MGSDQNPECSETSFSATQRQIARLGKNLLKSPIDLTQILSFPGDIGYIHRTATSDTGPFYELSRNFGMRL